MTKHDDAPAGVYWSRVYGTGTSLSKVHLTSDRDRTLCGVPVPHDSWTTTMDAPALAADCGSCLRVQSRHGRMICANPQILDRGDGRVSVYYYDQTPWTAPLEFWQSVAAVVGTAYALDQN